VVAEQALRYAAAQEAAFDPRRGVLVHGDARPFNLLQVPGHAAGFRLIDPEGVAAEPALELGVMMRNLKDGLAEANQRKHGCLDMLRIGDNVESNKVLTGVAKLTTMNPTHRPWSSLQR
jgi:aminoglycoside phosphotransferase (APT) family kinase protein